MEDTGYYFEADGTFVCEDYNHAKPFYSFFPGIAGAEGIPCWAFYVNRAQCLAGFGVHNKDGALQEFVPADKAPWYATCRGFRTFIKLERQKNVIIYEPFRMDNPLHWHIRTRMRISPAELILEETNQDLGLEVRVTYFTLPEERVAGLYRRTELCNLSREGRKLQVIDGLAAIHPAGFGDFHAKNMGATIRAWMNVSLEQGVPFYKLNYRPDDVPELYPVTNGNFYSGYTIRAGQMEPLSPLYDPTVIFGSGGDYQPIAFMAPDFQYPKNQISANQLPAAMGWITADVPGGERLDLYGLFGQAQSLQELRSFLPRVDAAFYQQKRERNQSLIRAIGDYAWCNSGEPLFDRYIRQCFTDNVIRGGLPVTIAGHGTGSPKVFWLYSRKHGDLERDYNDFQLSPSFYSQGNGNFRDINQNRRSDLWFNPEIGDGALHYFWNLIQLDGYNPLVIQGITYYCDDWDGLESKLASVLPEQTLRALGELLRKPYTPGDIWGFLTAEAGNRPDLCREVQEMVIQNSRELENAEPGEGYWVDHWTYNLDLNDTFRSIYPDRVTEAFLLRRDYSFYDNWMVAVPGAERFILVNGTVHPRSSVRSDPAKKERIAVREQYPHQVRTGNGAGPVYRTSLFVKMLVLAANKIAALDPFLTGLEMDAGRPGWCDAVNGLPGICGSSAAEVFELGRLLKQMEAILSEASLRNEAAQETIFPVPEEFHRFFAALGQLMEADPETDAERYAFWSASHQARDEYLGAIRDGISGREVELGMDQVGEWFRKCLILVKHAESRSFDTENGVYHTYFYHRVSKWRECNQALGSTVKPEGPIPVWPEAFEQYRLPHFLEGQVHALRCMEDKDRSQDLYRAVRESALFDRELGMYKVCADLSGAPQELGRIRVFPRGWLENESIFLHMEYKYLLELLRSGQCSEFFAALPEVLVCFADPAKYGRNPLENCSFIVSSAYPRAEMHCNGFVARLSGSTAEMLNLWLWMSFGPRPFRLNDAGDLELIFEPILDSRFFSHSAAEVEINGTEGAISAQLSADNYAAIFLGHTLVVYQNPSLRPTFGPDAAKVRNCLLYFRDGQKLEITGPRISGEPARQVRAGLVERIELYLE